MATFVSTHSRTLEPRLRSGLVWWLVGQGGEVHIASRWTTDAQLESGWQPAFLTNSLFSSWDNQFYPELAKTGSVAI